MTCSCPWGSASTSWRPTAAYVRAAAGGVLLAISAVVLRRPDLLVLATPLLAISVWSTIVRPDNDPEVVEQLDHHTLREGEGTTWRIGLVDPGKAEDVGVVLAAPPLVLLGPNAGAVAAGIDPTTGETDVPLVIPLRSMHWGRAPLGPAHVVATSAWAAFRWAPVAARAKLLRTLPLPAVFDAAAPTVHPVGLVGLNRSGRPGSGSEFASIRTFQPGDRLRRIHWPRSLRTGTLHVTSTWADQDSHVVLVIDAFSDVGTSEGIDGRASSLDISVRAAGAIAEHHLHRGDRVAVQVIGARGVTRVPPATGTSHLRRVLDCLSAIEPATLQHDDARLQLGLTAGALVVLLSPLVSPLALQRAVTLASRGITVVVVDTLPAGISNDDPDGPDDPYRSLAWRIRLLERRREMRRVQQAGVPIVQWRGPGSLDRVLRDLHRRARAPRMMRQ